MSGACSCHPSARYAEGELINRRLLFREENAVESAHELRKDEAQNVA
jgi:hypothetical protein